LEHTQQANNYKLLNIPEMHPIIIAGDINLHHSDWEEEMTTEPAAAANTVAQWPQGKSYLLLNV